MPPRDFSRLIVTIGFIIVFIVNSLILAFPTQARTDDIKKQFDPTQPTFIYETLLFDDFDDGDYEDDDPINWEIDWSHSGNPSGDPSQQDFDKLEIVCNASNCYLDGHNTNDPGYTKSVAFIYTDNPTNIGRWRFESRLKSSEDDSHNSLVLNVDSSIYNGDGYTLVHFGDGRLVFRREINDVMTDLLIQDGFGGQDDLWHIVELERNMAGEWKIYFDEQLVGSIVDLTVTDFPYLLIGRYGSIDNVRVERMTYKAYIPMIIRNPFANLPN